MGPPLCEWVRPGCSLRRAMEPPESKPMPGPQGSRPLNRWRISASTTSQASSATPSPTLPTGEFLTDASNILLLGPPGTGKPILRPGSDCAAKLGQGFCLPPPLTGLCGFRPRAPERAFTAGARPAASLRTDHRGRGRLHTVGERHSEPLPPTRRLH